MIGKVTQNKLEVALSQRWAEMKKGHQNATCQPSSERLKIQGKQNP